jgi:hypothetical protein
MGLAVRGHWGIENGLHGSVDVAYTAKDQAHMRAGNAAANFSILCRITLNLIRLDKARKTGIKNCRLKAGYRQNCSVCKTQLGAIVLPVAECEIWLGFSESENTPRG